MDGLREFFIFLETLLAYCIVYITASLLSYTQYCCWILLYSVQPSRIALFIQFGGLKFIEQLHFVSSRFLAMNPATFRNIDPTTLPPKEVSCTMKYARTKFMFGRKGAENKAQKRYRDFGLHTCEIEFVREAVNFILLLAKTTALEFDPAMEDMKVFENSRRTKKKLTFHRSALVVKSALRFSRGSDGKRLTRSSSARFGQLPNIVKSL